MYLASHVGNVMRLQAASRTQDTARLVLVRGEGVGKECGLQKVVRRGEGRGGCASETGSKIPTCALLFHQLFVSVLCEWTSTRILKQQQQQEAGTHTHTLHTFHAHTHTVQHTLGQTRAGRFGHFVLGLPTARPERISYITRHIGGYIYVYICMCACVWLHMLYICSSCIVYSAFHWII